MKRAVKTPPGKATDGEGPLVMVVDGDAKRRTYHAKIVQGFDFSVGSASSAAEALQMIADDVPALVLAELDLPVMSGRDLLRCLRGTQRTIGVPVIALSVNGVHMTFVKNDNFYEEGKPMIGTITVRIVPDEAVRKQMLINGDADLDMWTTEPMIADLQDEPTVVVSQSPFNRWVMRLFFNLSAKGTNDPVGTPHPILSDVNVRRASVLELIFRNELVQEKKISFRFTYKS